MQLHAEGKPILRADGSRALLRTGAGGPGARPQRQRRPGVREAPTPEAGAPKVAANAPPAPPSPIGRSALPCACSGRYNGRARLVYSRSNGACRGHTVRETHPRAPPPVRIAGSRPPARARFDAYPSPGAAQVAANAPPAPPSPIGRYALPCACAGQRGRKEDSSARLLIERRMPRSHRPRDASAVGSRGCVRSDFRIPSLGYRRFSDPRGDAGAAGAPPGPAADHDRWLAWGPAWRALAAGRLRRLVFSTRGHAPPAGGTRIVSR